MQHPPRGTVRVVHHVNLESRKRKRAEPTDVVSIRAGDGHAVVPSHPRTVIRGAESISGLDMARSSGTGRLDEDLPCFESGYSLEMFEVFS